MLMKRKYWGIGNRTSSWGKLNATDSDIRRGYFRGRKGELKLSEECLPLEEALKLAKISPPRSPAQVKPLGKPKKEIVVVRGSAKSLRDPAIPKPEKPKKKRKDRRWSVGSASSGNRILRNPGFLKPTTVVLPASSEPVPSNLKSDPRSTSGRTNKPNAAPPTFDGQPRFEGGIRFVQGGLPELGRR